MITGFLNHRQSENHDDDISAFVGGITSTCHLPNPKFDWVSSCKWAVVSRYLPKTAGTKSQLSFDHVGCSFWWQDMWMNFWCKECSMKWLINLLFVAIMYNKKYTTFIHHVFSRLLRNHFRHCAASLKVIQKFTVLESTSYSTAMFAFHKMSQCWSYRDDF